MSHCVTLQIHGKSVKDCFIQPRSRFAHSTKSSTENRNFPEFNFVACMLSNGMVIILLFPLFIVDICICLLNAFHYDGNCREVQRKEKKIKNSVCVEAEQTATIKKRKRQLHYEVSFHFHMRYNKRRQRWQ